MVSVTGASHRTRRRKLVLGESVMALRSLALLSAAALGAAQHHGFGPDFGKCTCETFCDKRCESEGVRAAAVRVRATEQWLALRLDLCVSVCLCVCVSVCLCLSL